MEAQGIVSVVKPTETVGANEFKKRELILEISDNPDYPQLVKFEAIKDKCDLLDKLNPGDEVKVHFNLNGRKWTNPKGEDQYFNTCAIWKFEVITPAANVGAPLKPVDISGDDSDSLPF